MDGCTNGTGATCGVGGDGVEDCVLCVVCCVLCVCSCVVLVGVWIYIT